MPYSFVSIFIYNLTEGTAIKIRDAEHPSGALCLELQVTAEGLLGQNILLHLHVTSAQAQAGDHKAGSDGLIQRR